MLFLYSKDEEYEDFAAVEKYRHEVLPEITPEGAYGSPIEPPLGKSSPWQPGQRSISAFTYENRELHEGLQRKDPGSHPPHDDPKK
ncbi:hypothetical protein [Salipaludibacillus keqinensis]|uniref:hypothetical protein n=1 Tax=Salipaludibacillus keqinensis TaxID=2045207 RepID=UPI002FCE1768